MNAEIARLVLALEPGAAPEPAEAVDLASRLGVPLLVLFGQDGDLRALGELPGRAALSLAGGRTQPVRAGELERELQVQARAAERAGRIAAERAGVSFRFEARSSTLAAWIQAHGSAEDLLMLRRNMDLGLRWGLPSRAMAWQALGPVLLTGRTRPTSPTSRWRTTSRSPERPLLGATRQSLLLVGEQSREPASAARAWVHGRGAEPLVQRLSRLTLDQLPIQTEGALVQIDRADLLMLDPATRHALVEAGLAVLVG